MRRIALPLSLLTALLLPLPAFADQIDDFTLTGPGTTMTFSLPAHWISPYPDHPHNFFFIEDGITFYTLEGTFPALQTSGLTLWGFSGIRSAFEGTFEIGTYTLVDGNMNLPWEDRIWTYTIAPHTDPPPVPEPAPLVLFGTGCLALLSLPRHRLHSRGRVPQV